MQLEILGKNNGVPCEIFTRVVGYYRPVDQTNRGKMQEISERKMMTIPEALKCKTSAGTESEKCLKLN